MSGSAAPMTDEAGREIDLERVGLRVEQLLDEVGAADPMAATAASELVRELLELYGTGLARILAMLDDLAPGVGGRLGEDTLVAGLFALHDLHPVDVRTRVERALDEVRPYLGSHGGDVELVDVADDVVHLRLLGSCNGCGASASTLEMAVDGAIRQAAPEIDRLEVEGAVDPTEANEGLIPLSSLTIRRGEHDATGGGTHAGRAAWTSVEVATVPADRLAARDVEGHRILLARLGEDLYAYHDACPACAGSLDGATIKAGAATCPACEVRYDVRVAGRRVGTDGPGMTPVPLVKEAGSARIALGVRP